MGAPSLSPTPSVTRTPSVSVTPSVTPSISRTPSVTPSVSISPSLSPSISPTPSITPSISTTPDTKSQIKVVGTELQYEIKDRTFSIEGQKNTSVTSRPNGSVWVVDQYLVYTDQFGDNRIVVGTTDGVTSNKTQGQIFISYNDRLSWISQGSGPVYEYIATEQIQIG